jgi:hypothetical protein
MSAVFLAAMHSLTLWSVTFLVLLQAGISP